MTFNKIVNLKDSKNFSVNKKTMNSKVEEIDDKILKIYREKVLKVIRKIDEIGLPKKGQQYRIVTMRSFNAVNFLEYIIEKEKYIKELYMCIYSINFFSAKILEQIANKGVKVTIVMSSLRNGSYNRKERIVNETFIKNKNIKLIFAVSHAKIMAVNMNDNFYVLEGSGNLNANSRIEQYIIDNSKEVYLFHKNWIDEIESYLGKSVTING
jgi:predicted transcriptional regulator